MATTLKNLSDFHSEDVPSAAPFKFAIVVAEWNKEITGSLEEGAKTTLLKHGAKEEKLMVKRVPGSIELTLGAQLIAENADIDAIICLGSVIQGETPHFDFVCQSVTQGITDLNIKYNKPFIFGVLTTDNQQQAKDRAGGKHGNKGNEAAIAAIKMASMKRELENLK